MKRIFSAISLVLVFVLLLSVAVSANEVDSNVYTPPKGMAIIYANDLTGASVPSIDGNISENEYGKLSKIETDPFKMAAKWPENIYSIDEDSDRPSPGTIEYYFAYDENNVYIAFKEYGQVFDDANTAYADYAMRNNYGIEFGFDLLDISNYFLHVVTYGGGCWNKDLRLSEGKSSNFASLDVKPEALYSEFFVNKYAAKDAALPDDERTLFAFGDIISAQNTNATEPYILEVEMRIDKQTAIELYNTLAYTNYASFPNAMYFSMGAHVYRGSTDGTPAKEGHARYLATDKRETKLEDYLDYGILPGSPQECLPYLIVLGDENTVITVPEEKVETEAPDTEAETLATETNAPAEETSNSNETEAVVTEGGCGSAITITGLALVATLGTCTVFISKKR
ncbi:MAG: hypothetical protein IKB02_07220 [Clostridia bacterium]|nr:hypothetical protein [Clostridia bacterium]